MSVKLCKWADCWQTSYKSPLTFKLNLKFNISVQIKIYIQANNSATKTSDIWYRRKKASHKNALTSNLFICKFNVSIGWFYNYIDSLYKGRLAYCIADAYKVAQITARSVFDVGFVKASIKSTTKYIFTGVSSIFTDSVCRIYLTLLMSSLKIA